VAIQAVHSEQAGVAVQAVHSQQAGVAISLPFIF